MKSKNIIYVAIVLAIAILGFLIVVKTFPDRKNYVQNKGSEEKAIVEKADMENEVAKKASGTSAVKGKNPPSEKDLKIQRLVGELRSLNAGQEQIPQAEGVIKELCGCGNDAIFAMKELLSSDAKANTKAYAARVLAQIGTAESVGVLVEGINSESNPVSKDLFIRSLQGVDKAEASPPLIKCLESSKDIFLNMEMKQALARTGNEETVKQLVEACHVQKGANSGMENLLGALSLIRNPDALPALSNTAANEEDPKIRKNALRAISNMGNENAARALVEMLQSEKNAGRKPQIIDAISLISGKESLDYLRGLSNNIDYPEELRMAAAKAVFTIKNGLPPAE